MWLARNKSAFTMNNIQRADVTLLHVLWMTKLQFATHSSRKIRLSCRIRRWRGHSLNGQLSLFGEVAIGIGRRLNGGPPRIKYPLQGIPRTAREPQAD